MSNTYTSRPSLQARGRGERRQNSIGRNPTDTQRKPGETATANKSRQKIASPGRGRAHNKSMDYTGQRLGRDPNRFEDDGSGEGSNNRPNQDRESGPTHNTGYRVFQPNERRRQKISEMAQREAQAHEEFKKANAPKSFSYVGTTGGGEITHDQARLRQANSVRAQMFNRRMKQEDHRQAKKRAEEEEIAKKKAEARRKAEQNALRDQQLGASPEDVRRKRAAFLNQLEKNTSSGASSSVQQPQNSSTPLKRPQPSHSVSSTTSLPVGSVFHTTADKRMNKTSKSHASKSSASRYMSTEDSKPTSHARGASSNFRHNSSPEPNEDEGIETDELTILTSMFPDLDPDYLSDLLFQMGSVDAVVEVLGE